MMTHTKVCVNVHHGVFTLNALLDIKSDPSTLVLEAFFHPT